MVEVKEDMIALGAHAPTLADFHGHAAAHDVAGRQVLGVGRIALHEALAFGIDEIPALAARALGDQAPEP